MKVAVIFGGISSEHDVSIVSGSSVIKNLDKEKYEILPIYIDKKGDWYEYIKNLKEIEIMKIGESPKELRKIDNIIETLKKQDLAFPVLHGLGGEDGTIQGLFELAGIPYVGCKVLASSIAMDKVYTKIILEKAKIQQVKSAYVKAYQKEHYYIDEEFNEVKGSMDEICNSVEKKIAYPMFVKPSNSGSSVGVSKVKTKAELKTAIEYASQFDEKILVEQGIIGHEVECAVLGNEKVVVGEVRRSKGGR